MKTSICAWIRSKASRAKRLLQKRERIKEEKKARALAAGVDVNYDDLDDEPAVNFLVVC